MVISFSYIDFVITPVPPLVIIRTQTRLTGTYVWNFPKEKL